MVHCNPRTVSRSRARLARTWLQLLRELHGFSAGCDDTVHALASSESACAVLSRSQTRCGGDGDAIKTNTISKNICPHLKHNGISINCQAKICRNQGFCKVGPLLSCKGDERAIKVIGELTTSMGHIGLPVLSKQTEHHSVEDGQDVRRMTHAELGMILIHRYIPAMMQSILDSPMSTHQLQQSLRRRQA